MKIKKWWVLAWHDYYPKEMLDNVYATFYEKEDAMECAGNLINNEKIINPYDNVKVINVEDMLQPID